MVRITAVTVVIFSLVLVGLVGLVDVPAEVARVIAVAVAATAGSIELAAAVRSLRAGRSGATRGPRRAEGTEAPRAVGRPRGARSDGPAPSSRQPSRYGVSELVSRLGIPEAHLRATPLDYLSFTIPKRAGGTRRIDAPNGDLKHVQRLILQRIVGRLPAHPAVHGFERRRSIATNARPHVGRALVVRMDLAEFFASTSARRVRRYFRVIGWDAPAARLLTDLTTLDGALPQGAPTSPRLANLVNTRMDARLTALTQRLGAVYTRYADDLTFSFATDEPRATHRLVRAVKRIVRDEGYRLHEGRKLRIRRRHDQQRVTGLVVNEHLALARRTRRWLRAVEHHRRVGRPASLDDRALAGWQALVRMVMRAGG